MFLKIFTPLCNKSPEENRNGMSIYAFFFPFFLCSLFCSFYPSFFPSFLSHSFSSYLVLPSSPHFLSFFLTTILPSFSPSLLLSFLLSSFLPDFLSLSLPLFFPIFLSSLPLYSCSFVHFFLFCILSSLLPSMHSRNQKIK